MYDKRWTIEQHFNDLDKKMLALRRMTEHHMEEAAKSRIRERHLVETYLSMVQDVKNDLWWEIGELEDSLNNRDSLFYVGTNQAARNSMWSEWVDKKMEYIRLERSERELNVCLEAL